MPHQCTTCGYVFEDGSKEMLSGCPECSGTTFQFHPDETDLSETPPDEDPSPPAPSPQSNGGRVGRHVDRATSTVREWVTSGSSATNGASRSDSDPGSDSDPDSNESTSGESNEMTTEGTTAETTEATETTETATKDSSDEMESENNHGANRTAEDDEYGADVLATDGEDRVHANDSENAAQASARSEFVSRDKLPPHSSSSSSSSSASSLPSPSSEASSPASSPPSDGHVVREPTGDQPDLAELRQELNDQFESIKIIEPGQYELNLMELYDRDEYIIALQENGRYVIQMPESWRGSDDE